MGASSPLPNEKSQSDAPLADAFALAYRVASKSAPGEVRSVRVVGGRPLTIPELRRLHADAREQGLQITMDGGGSVAIRRAQSNDDLDCGAEQA